MSKILNVEIKAKCNDPDYIRDYLKKHDAHFRGVDHQIDTYFNCDNGRLKLRSGNIENSLIFYKRNNQLGPKTSDIALTRLENNTDLVDTLAKALGVMTIIDKKREIYFIDNVKFHIDDVKNLGSFVEIEAIDEDGRYGLDKLNEKCEFYLEAFKIQKADLLSGSYSDMVDE